jgi:hypothetical protein
VSFRRRTRETCHVYRDAFTALAAKNNATDRLGHLMTRHHDFSSNDGNLLPCDHPPADDAGSTAKLTQIYALHPDVRISDASNICARVSLRTLSVIFTSSPVRHFLA